MPQDRKFIGFDGYKKAMDCLKPGDIVISATPPAFRWVHFAYAIEKGLNVFMEKPVTVDGPTSRKMLKLAEEATAKNLKVGRGPDVPSQPGAAGTAQAHPGRRDRRHHPACAATACTGRSGRAFQTKWPGDPSELLWQIRHFHSFLWASGGCYSDFYIHVIDHLCWMKNAWPVKAQALGGRHYSRTPTACPTSIRTSTPTRWNTPSPTARRMIMDGRCMNGCNDIYASYAHGSKGIGHRLQVAAIAAAPPCIFKGQNPQRANMIWTSKVAAGPGRTPIRTNGTT